MYYIVELKILLMSKSNPIKYLIKFVKVGLLPHCSIVEITCCVNPVFLANSFCVIPFSFLTLINLIINALSISFASNKIFS